jgi:hypothetical protein
LTGLRAFRTLTLVRRLAALLLVPSLLAMSGPALHTHAYDDHDHPEHQHGLASHEHLDDVAARRDDGGTHVEGCDPGEHAVEVAFLSAAPQPPPAVEGVSNLATLARPITRHGPAVRHTDVRAHGPPSRTQSSPRAPPPIHA